MRDNGWIHAQGEGDRSAPQLQQTTPDDNATGVAVNANLILTFNEAVKAGAGAIEIRNAATGQLVQSILITDASKISFSGNQVSINPGSDLSPDTGYYVTFGSGVIRDLANNAFAGISSAAVFSFTTEEDYVDTTAPVIIFASPDGDVDMTGWNYDAALNETLAASQLHADRYSGYGRRRCRRRLAPAQRRAAHAR